LRHNPQLENFIGELQLLTVIAAHSVIIISLPRIHADYLLPFPVHYTPSGCQMSYRGRPSKGCESCRARKVKVSCHSQTKCLSIFQCLSRPPFCSFTCLWSIVLHLLLEYVTDVCDSAMRRNRPATAAANQITNASIATKQIFSFVTRLHLLRRGPKSHGERDRRLINAHAVTGVYVDGHLRVTGHHR
jgi:hypothetical protein